MFVFSRTLQKDLLPLCHKDFQGGHQGSNITQERLRQEKYWIRMYGDDKVFVKECEDCVTTKGSAPNRGNILATCGFSDFIICKPMRDIIAQEVVAAYIEQGFQRSLTDLRLMANKNSPYRQQPEQSELTWKNKIRVTGIIKSRT
ncbi:Gypsy Retrotransposon integrase [Phytophthora megakarya]|uniref:Gypsy Retrotransposon integrase n=1 Tax=Phytophthora megakarya TaxID=4795 RepID=A0A225WCP8_9STRA|nr:Gypsy Retrotransposon integrase [Phytophthora megakarya]